MRARPVRAVHLTGDGAVDPVAVTRALVRAAQGHGARLLASTPVSAVRVRGGRVVGVRTPGGTLPADAVVLSAGVGTPALCAPLGLDLPVVPSPAVLVRASAPAGLVRTLVAAPHLEVRQGADGRLLLTVGPGGEGGAGGEGGRGELQRLGEEVLR
ncbi:NAD(P)/FAD-dependent oxidoreductase, partial [Kineococcus indalonis]|uniref:NAD(P)/FAD-dependent oxidoreductase n=1 Tax=Kineococcus indalonis TaxID=2696566 RepID=UPI0023F42E7E